MRNSYVPNTDGIVYLWQISDSKLSADTPSTYTLVDSNPIAGFAMRSDGYPTYWDSTNHNAYIVFVAGTSTQIDTTTMQGFGGTSNGNIYLWRSDGKLEL